MSAREERRREDRRRRELYLAETRLEDATRSGGPGRLLSLGEAQSLANKAAAARGMRPMKIRTLEEKRAHGYADVVEGEPVVLLSRRARTPLGVVHEVTHHATSCHEHGHGDPIFIHDYLRAVRDLLGARTAAVLRSNLRREGYPVPGWA